MPDRLAMVACRRCAHRYRQQLRPDLPDVVLVELDAERDELERRVQRRSRRGLARRYAVSTFVLPAEEDMATTPPRWDVTRYPSHPSVCAMSVSGTLARSSEGPPAFRRPDWQRTETRDVMPILNRILGAIRGAASSGGGATGRGRPVPGTTPGAAHGGTPRSGRGLLSSLLNSRRGGRPRI